MENEIAVWNAWRSGDESSFKLMFNHYYDPLFNYGHKFTADEFIIEEALQNLFVKLWKNRDSIGEAGSVKNYLYQSFRRLLLRSLSQNPRLQSLTDGDDKVNFMIELGHDDRIADNERLSEIKKNLESALATLSPRQREIIHLRYFEEMDYDQIAAVMDLSVASTYKLLYRAVDSLKSHFSPMELALVFSLLALSK